MSEPTVLTPEPDDYRIGEDSDLITDDLGPDQPNQSLTGADSADVESSGATAAAAAYGLVNATGQWKDIRRRFVRNKLAVVGLVMIVIVVFVAIFAPLLAPYNPRPRTCSTSRAGRARHHWFGTDVVGRDQLSRVIYGARIALIVGLSSIVLASFIGVFLGAVAGYFGRFWDSLIMRICDIFFAFPLLVGAIVDHHGDGPGRGAGDHRSCHLRVGDGRPAAARFDPVGTRVGVRRGCALARGQPMADRDAPHPAQQLRAGAVFAAFQRRHRRRLRSRALLPRGRRQARRPRVGKHDRRRAEQVRHGAVA